MRTVTSVLIFMICNVVYADEYSNMSDDQIHDLINSDHPDSGCLYWRYEARYFHTLLPRDSTFPQEVRQKLIQKGHGLAGKNKKPVTSVNYILKKKMFDMTVSGSSPEETEVAVFEQCMKYDRKYTDQTGGGGSHPAPELRASKGE